MIRRIPVALLVAGLAGNFLSSAVETTPLPLVHPRVTTGESARLTSGFIENRGQWSGSARFAARRGSVAAALEPDRIRLQLDAADAATVALVFEGASSRVTLEGEDQRPGVYNFISGNIASAWQMNVPAFDRVIYRGMYAGVDVRLREQARHFEYDLIVSPRADLRQVVVRVEGASSLALDADGSLLIQTAAGLLRQTPPITSETLPGGATRPLASTFRLIDAHHYGFEAPDRDPSLPVVVDPGLIWSTLSGGTGAEDLTGLEVAKDGSGDLFLSGTSTSTDFATSSSPVQTGRYKAFVARLDESGSHYDFVTFINGLQNQTYPGGMAADALGGVTLVGTTVDLDFPVTQGAYQSEFASPINGLSRGDGFVTRLNATGGLVFSTYLGGIDNDGAGDVVIDSSGALIVIGTTSSPDFPTTAGAYDRTFNAAPAGDNTAASQDTFIARLSADGTQLTYGTYFGGQTYEVVLDSIVDAQGFLTIAGATTSSATGRDIPVTGDAFDATWNGSEDGFIARFRLDGNGTADLKYSSFLGGVNVDTIEGIAFDPNDPTLVTVAGHSWYDNFTGPFFPTTAGVFKPKLTPSPPVSQLFPHSKTGFVTKFRFPAGAAGSLVWSTFAGGNWEDWLSDIAIDDTGAAIVVGGTRSYDLITTRGAHDRTQDGLGLGPHDCFVWKLSPNGAQLTYSTYLGGVYEECDAVLTIGAKVAYLGNNTIAIAGMTGTGDFETTSGAVTRTAEEVNGGDSPFVAKLTLAADATGDLTVSAPALLSPPPNSVSGGSGGVVRLGWTAVDDPSGIEGYVYEVSVKPDFPANFTAYKGSVNANELILESTAITIPYFWRVRAADRAGNLSDWSTVGTFTAGVTGAASIVDFIQVYPSTVTGGASAQGVLHLTDPAPPGGAVVTLSTKDPRGFLRTVSPITLPSTVTVPAGAITANFPIGTVPVSALTPVAIYATIGGVGDKVTMSVNTVQGPKVASLTLDPFAVTGGNPATGIVTLTAPAAPGGAVVPILSSHSQYASVPASVTVPAGAMTATFPITTSPVPFAFDVTIEATGGQFAAQRLALKTPGPRLTSFTLSASNVTGGSTLTGTVSFSGPIPPSPFPAIGDAVVTLKSTSSAIGLSPFAVVPVGQTSATFAIGVQNVPVTTPLEIVASYDNTVLRAPLTVTGRPASLASVTLNVTTLTAGHGGVGFVNLTAPAPGGNVLVRLSGSHPALTLPAEVLVPAGGTSGIFSYGSTAVAATTPVTITATYGSSTASAALTINPSTPTNLWVTSLALNPTTVAAGASSTATVTINAAAPSTGVSVQLSSTSPATVPPSVIIPAGETSATFNVGTTSVSTTTLAKVRAMLNTNWGAVLTVTAGGGGSTPTLASVSLSPSSVTGGATSQGTVTLSAAAPSGGAVVALSSSNTAAATVPGSVTVSAGSTSRTFTVTTATVSSSTSATITGTLGVSRSATLNVNASTPTPAAPSLVAPASGATVTLPVTFDWNDVANAVSYQLHVDDSSSFTTPRVIDVTVTASQHTATSLANRQHWWRVRGRNSAGTAGAWSSVRSFTPQGTPSAPALSALAMSPASVTGGTAVQGTATLTSAAPSGGAVVTLTSSNTAAATVSSSVTVPAGATSATFTVTTKTVTASAAATITGAYGGATRTATVTVNPTSPTGTATLTVSATGRSGERITSTPAGINVSVGSTGSASFTAGTSITLSVSNGRDAIWSGACSSGGDKRRTCTFTLNTNASVTGNVQ
jgi:hypothetical protein